MLKPLNFNSVFAFELAAVICQTAKETTHAAFSVCGVWHGTGLTHPAC